MPCELCRRGAYLPAAPTASGCARFAIASTLPTGTATISEPCCANQARVQFSA